MEVTIHIRYKNSVHHITCTLEYKSSQIMRFRVPGNKGSLLLENNYPLLRFADSKKGVQWKIREGAFTEVNKESTEMFTEILRQLERFMKKEFDTIYSTTEGTD